MSDVSYQLSKILPYCCKWLLSSSFSKSFGGFSLLHTPIAEPLMAGVHGTDESPLHTCRVVQSPLVCSCLILCRFPLPLLFLITDSVVTAQLLPTLLQSLRLSLLFFLFPLKNYFLIAGLMLLLYFNSFGPKNCVCV